MPVEVCVPYAGLRQQTSALVFFACGLLWALVCVWKSTSLVHLGVFPFCPAHWLIIVISSQAQGEAGVDRVWGREDPDEIIIAMIVGHGPR